MFLFCLDLEKEDNESLARAFKCASQKQSFPKSGVELRGRMYMCFAYWRMYIRGRVRQENSRFRMCVPQDPSQCTNAKELDVYLGVKLFIG